MPYGVSETISVIMPCFNAEAYIEYSVNSILAQTFEHTEIIIIDDGSSDNTLSIVKKLEEYNSNIKLFTQSRSGPYPARNLGLKHSTGQYIAFLDADDYWEPYCLEKLYNALISKNADLSYCGWQNVIENGQNGPKYVPPAYETGDLIDSILKSCPWPIHAALIKRSIVENVGGFSTRCFSSMDYDFWLRICAVTRNITLVPEVLAYYRWHSHGQISSVKWKQVLDSWQVRKDFIEQYPQLSAHIPESRLSELIDGFLINQAYTTFWKGDLVSARELFRAMFFRGIWQLKDAKYVATSLLPFAAFKLIVSFSQ